MKTMIAMLILFAGVVQAETIVQWSKGYTASCSDAVEREDGTPLAPEEIARVEYYLDDVDGNVTNPSYTAIMSGGCQPVFIDTKRLTTGSYYAFAITVDTDGRESVASLSKQVVIQKAKPKPPTGLTP